MNTNEVTNNQTDDDVLTADEARQVLRLGRSKFYKLLADGRVKYFRQGSRRYFRRRFLEDYLATLTVIGDTEAQ